VSYDLKLFHLPDGVDPEDAFNELAEREENNFSPILRSGG
jgi:hypothetical protein